MRWPEGFMWGTAASSTQAEGAGPASDWRRWEQLGRAPASGDGNGFAEQFAEDFSTFASLGLVHHRMSLDWSRIEPALGRIDRDAVAHYRRMLTAAREAGIMPWACLHHFSLPSWFADVGGFEREESWRTHWMRHVDLVAVEFGQLVEGWQPVNEPNYYASLSYGRGRFPPADPSPEARWRAAEGIHLATAEAAARLRTTGKPVCSIYGLSTAVALDDSDATRTRIAKHNADHWDSWIGLFLDGVLRLRGRPSVEAAHLKGCFDLIGFSYYRTVGILDGNAVRYPADAPMSDAGYAVSADGLGAVLDKLGDEVPGTPLVVAEYGVGTADDELRTRYLAQGLRAVRSAIDSGIDVRGFFHWTGVDNYEWMHGYDVSFGLLSRARVLRPSAQVLAAEALA